jgi:hypothetical protein
MDIFLVVDNSINKIIIEYTRSLHKKIPNSKIIYYSNEMKIENNNIYIFLGLHYINSKVYLSSLIYKVFQSNANPIH